MRGLLKLVQGGLKGFWGAQSASASTSLPIVRRSFETSGTSVNWDALANAPTLNPAYFSAVAWVAKSVNQAEPNLKKRNRDGTEEVLNDHPLLRLLRRPNPYMDRQGLFAGLVMSLLTEGNAYLGIERDKEGLPVELCWLSPDRVAMCKEPNSTESFDHWEFRQANGTAVKVPKQDIVHIKYMVDPEDPRFGVSPMRALRRQQYILDQGTNYIASVLKNFGAGGTVITPTEANTIIDPKELIDLYNAKTQGDRAGSVIAFDIPVTIHHPKSSPQDLAIETLLDRSEADICAVLGVPPQVLGLHCGRLSKTYANMREAREVAWEETVLPLLNLLASGLAHALLPELSEGWQRLSLGFDTSQIRPLLPDQDAIHVRLREDWKAGLIDRAMWKRGVGMQPAPEDVGVYYANISGGGNNGSGA